MPTTADTPAPGRAVRRILVAVDEGEASERVASFVNDFFGGLDVDVTAINVGTSPLTWMPDAVAPGALSAWYVGPPVAPVVVADTEALTVAAERAIDRSGVHEDHRIVELGDPVDVIARAAVDHDMDLIVVGSTHKNLLERFLTGSVSVELAQQAPVPVLVVH